MKRGTVVSIGTFDGNHLGHQAILRELRLQAQAHSLPSLVYAFSVPPRWALQGDDERYLLLPTSIKVDMLRQSANIVHSSAFESVRAMDPEHFVETVLIKQLSACKVVEGESFRFGRNRSGDVKSLQSIGSSKGLTVVSVPPVMIGGETVSSTRIRNAIRSNDFQTAHKCLGRPPILVGSVIGGDHLGHKLGFPTANVAVDPHVLLPHPGIFLVHVLSQSVCANGLLYVGSRPTLKKNELRCEVHLLDFADRHLYGEIMEIHLLKHIRDDRPFDSLNALSLQIEADIEVARDLMPAFPLTEQRFSS